MKKSSPFLVVPALTLAASALIAGNAGASLDRDARATPSASVPVVAGSAHLELARGLGGGFGAGNDAKNPFDPGSFDSVGSADPAYGGKGKDAYGKLPGGDPYRGGQVHDRDEDAGDVNKARVNVIAGPHAKLTKKVKQKPQQPVADHSRMNDEDQDLDNRANKPTGKPEGVDDSGDQ
jgi:hypothetical protein